MKSFVLLSLCSLPLTVHASRCNGEAQPGPRNLLPIDVVPPKFVKQVPNGKLFTIGQGDDVKDLIHVWGTPYDNGMAMGTLLGPKLPTFIRQVYQYMEGQIVSNLANATWCATYQWRCKELREVMKLGIEKALNLSYHQTAPYLKPYVVAEIAGLADSTGGQASEIDIRNVMWLGELSRGACSMFGAKASATSSSGGHLLQLRALDWDTDGPFKNFATVVVYHPNEGDGHAWANLGFSGWTASVTGFSEARLGLSEIGVSFPDESFGPEHYLAAGYPFGFLIRDILQFDTSLEEATTRITTAKRTCDLILGVGDGRADDFSAFQYSPSVATVIKPDTLLPANDSWHPRIADVVYFGMDWICPNDNAMLAHQLRQFHGRLTPEITISDVTSYVGTGDLHIAIYDHAEMHMYVATARPDGGAGPLPAYQRQFTRLDMLNLFAEPPPKVEVVAMAPAPEVETASEAEVPTKVEAPAQAEVAPLPPDAKAACAALDLPGKVSLMHGFGAIDGYSRNSGCGGYCGRQTFRWDNGPQGFGDHSPAGNSTQWPSTLNVAATWDPSLARAWGEAMGAEWYGKGTNFLEGPGINVMRVPYNGRTFEYISGEDPVLGSALVGPTIDGMQLHSMAIAKHYILNNQETDRSGVNELIDEKTLMELYSPPFEMAARHNVAGYMCAYNRINSVWACEQPETLRTMLKGYFNFQGFIVSDWGATHSTADALNAGLDIEMPGSKYFNVSAVQAAIRRGEVSTARIEESCERILSRWYAQPAAQRYPCAAAGQSGICIARNVSTAAHKALARQIAAQSTVLLKNQAPGGTSGADVAPLLPLSRGAAKPTLALIGPDAKAPYTAGGGSGHVDNSNVAVSPLMAFEARGYSVEYVSGCKADGSADLEGVAAAAARADVAIIFVSAKTTEGRDRASLNLSSVECGGAAAGLAAGRRSAAASFPQEELIETAAAAQPRSVVSMVAPGPMLTRWRARVAALLCAFLPGEQYGNAIADLILGDAMPQARLPVSMPMTANDQGMSEHQFPGVPSADFPGDKEVVYSEGQLSGYRWYDKHQVLPAYAFGFGLTYGAPFRYSALRVRGRTISFRVTREAGGAPGCDTPQLYLSYPDASEPGVPVKVLRYFEKTCDDSTDVTYTLTDRDVSTWNTSLKQWVVVRGTFGIQVAQAAHGALHLSGSVVI